MTFDLVPESVFRALRYIELVNQSGVHPTTAQVNEFARSDRPAEPIYQNAFSSVFSAFAESLFNTTKIRDGETVTGYLVRLDWAEDGLGGLLLTALGRAFLNGAKREIARSDEGNAVPTMLVLEPSNEMSQVELAQAAANAGEGMLLDPYLKPLALHWLITSSSLTRALLKKPKEGAGAFAVALGNTHGSQRLEVRATESTEFHDRAIVAADGAVTLFGTSVNGVDRHLTTMVQLGPEDAASYRARLEQLYAAAEIIEPVRLDGKTITAAAAESKPAKKAAAKSSKSS